MKRKDKEALQEASREELVKKLRETESSLAEFLKERYTKQSKNIRRGKEIRDQIARIKTILRVKEEKI